MDNREPGAIAPQPRVEFRPPVSPASEKTPALATASPAWWGNQDAQEYLEQTFLTKFNHLESFMPKGSQTAEVFKKQMDALVARSVADEFQKEETYVHNGPDGPETLTAERVLMFKRAAFITRINEKAKYHPGNHTYEHNPAFVFLDLKDLYAANSAGSADWLLSRVAQTINFTTRTYFEKIKMPGNYSTCRYGGDEFVIGTVDLTPEQNVELQAQIKAALGEVTGYYRNPVSRQVEARQVEVNASKDSIINVPEDPVDREIFVTYLNRGLILDAGEIAKVRKSYPLDTEKNRSEFQDVAAKHHQYETMPERIYHAFFNDPDLALAMTLADNMDRHEEADVLAKAIQKSTTEKTGLAIPQDFTPGKRKANLVRLLDEAVLDPLLGDNVLSLEGMREQIENAGITQVACVDLKFIKEINETASMAEGDKAIENLWSLLGLKLDNHDKHSYMFARRGGTFFVGLRREAAGSKHAAEWLRCLKPDYLVVKNGKAVDLPLGASVVSCSDLPAGESRRDWAGKVLGQAVEQAEDDWYAQTATDIREHNPALFKMLGDISQAMESPGTSLEVARVKARLLNPDFAESATGYLPSLETKFFFGKPGLRTDQRQERILRELFGQKKPLEAAV